MQISELASRAGVSTHAIRHYESLGLIAARRRPSGYREFDEGVIRELRFIVMSRQCGFSLKQIAEVLPAYRSKVLTAARMIAMLEGRIAEIDTEIAKQHALRTHLVSHIDWFREREQRAGKKPGFPRARSRRGTDAGPAGKRRSKA
ncbi:MerR family transcriptional regulator [Paraburkholderia sp. Se-20369]|nr:MerR family transcriptional regulator [Paraburkholderia sp. Se-20369]TCW85424.1 MerR family transcriptional regulator [Burkholderia sp. SRS-46]